MNLNINFLEALWQIFCEAGVVWKIITIITVVLLLITVSFYGINIIYINKKRFVLSSTHIIHGNPTSMLLIDSNKSAESVNLAILVTALNRRGDLVKITDYALEVFNQNKWIRLKNMSTFDNFQFGWIKSDGVSCSIIYPEPGFFDVNARKKYLKNGEVVEGWMFYQFPQESHITNEDFKIAKKRIVIWDSLSGTQTKEIDIKKNEAANSWLQSTSFKVIKIVKLSSFNIKNRTVPGT